MTYELHLKSVKKAYRLLDFTSMVSEIVCLRNHLRNYISSEFPGLTSDAQGLLHWRCITLATY